MLLQQESEFKLRSPVTIDIDDTPVVVTHLRCSQYTSNNAMAVQALYQDGGQDAVSINIPERADMLEEGEFWLSDGIVSQAMVEAKVVLPITKKTAYTGDRVVVAARINLIRML